jgi:hypothetical protein
MSWVTPIKNALVSDRLKPRRILTGEFRAITLEMSLQNGMQMWLGLFERETYPWLRKLAAGVRTGIDIGAANGEYTIYLLKKTAAKVFYFEPDLKFLPILDRNLSLNGLKTSSRIVASTEYVDERPSPGVTQLDSMLQVIEGPCLIKMDVDGAEDRILRGAVLVNKLSGTRWLIETHSPQLEEVCVRILKAGGFDTRIIPNAWWRIIVPELRPVQKTRWLAAWKG